MVRIWAGVLTLWLCALAPAAAWAGELRVYFFDVGQGDAALIISPTGRTVLIDAGPPSAAAALRDRLQALLTGPLDVAILTHAHLDHLGGMAAALGARGVRQFIDSGFAHPSPSDAALRAYLRAHQIPTETVHAGQALELGGGAQLRFLAPKAPFLTGTASDANANSVVAKLVFGKRSVLFMGDAEPQTEARLLADGAPLRADVLKVSHHGVGRSTTAALVAAVHPGLAVISCGVGNDVGAPSRAVEDRLRQGGARVLRTDLDGEVRIVSDGQSLQVHRGGDQAPAAAEPAPVADAAPPPASPHTRTAHHGGRAHHAAAPHVIVMPVSAGAASAPADHPVGGSYVASAGSGVFHKAGCRNAKRIKAKNRVTFATRKEALDSGRTPAGCCHP